MFYNNTNRFFLVLNVIPILLEFQQPLFPICFYIRVRQEEHVRRSPGCITDDYQAAVDLTKRVQYYWKTKDLIVLEKKKKKTAINKLWRFTVNGYSLEELIAPI